MRASQNDVDQPFRFSKPKLVSQKVQSQVILCDAFDVQRNIEIPCILKFFPPGANTAYERELAVYSAVESSTELQESVPLSLWSGTWSAAKYFDFLGHSLPKSLRKNDGQISVIGLPYIHSVDSISNGPEDLRLFLAKSALHSLRRLHANRITHGDVSVSNVLIEREDDVGYSLYWIDFSSSTVEASTRSIIYEWEKALEYFSDLVHNPFDGPNTQR